MVGRRFCKSCGNPAKQIGSLKDGSLIFWCQSCMAVFTPNGIGYESYPIQAMHLVFLTPEGSNIKSILLEVKGGDQEKLLRSF